MSNKIDRATEIHRSMTSHQMALRIVELEDIAEIVGQLASERASRITELQAALELAEEAVRAKHFPGVGNMVPDGWQLVPVEPTFDMQKSGSAFPIGDDDLNLIDMSFEEVRCIYSAMLSAAPKPGGE